jgi:hypothetical protein
MDEQTQYRKKPVVITASQWFKNGDHPEDYSGVTHGLENGEPRRFSGAYRRAQQWEGSVVRYYRHPAVAGDSPCEQCGKPHHIHGWIDTLEQGHRVCPGDWIITGVKGERYPCKPDIFSATYELAVLSQPAAQGDSSNPAGGECGGVQVPLTDAQIHAVRDSFGDEPVGLVAFARAIEAARGIKATP